MFCNGYSVLPNKTNTYNTQYDSAILLPSVSLFERQTSGTPKVFSITCLSHVFADDINIDRRLLLAGCWCATNFISCLCVDYFKHFICLLFVCFFEHFFQFPVCLHTAVVFQKRELPLPLFVFPEAEGRHREPARTAGFRLLAKGNVMSAMLA